jgi:hypothetical protein
VVIAEFNNSLNEVKGLRVYTHPTLIYYTKDFKKGIKYEGKLEIDALKDYIT